MPTSTHGLVKQATVSFVTPSTTLAEMTTEPESDGEVNFLTLTLTIVRFMFGSKGYVHQEDWESYVNFSAIRDRCFFATQTIPDTGEPQDRIECTAQEADLCLANFLYDQAVYYFYVYLACSLCLITLAILFNVIAILAVARCREKYPRHHVFISLSVSDLVLTTSLLLKRCSDEEGVLSPSNRQLLRNNVAVFFHIGYLMSAIGLLCLSLDNVLAVAAPYFYESLSRPRSTRIFIGCLWTVAMTFSVVLRILELQLSPVVQIAVNVGMLLLLVGVLSSYIFVCAQSHVHRRRLAVLTDDRRVVDVRTQLRGFLTTGLLVFWCLLCWSPLVGYWLTDDDTISASHRFFIRYLVAAVIVLHLNSVVDPIIYCLRLRDIRKSLFQLLRIHKRARQQSIIRSVQYSTSGQSWARNGSGRKSSPAYALGSNNSSVESRENRQRDHLLPTHKPVVKIVEQDSDHSGEKTTRNENNTSLEKPALANGNGPLFNGSNANGNQHYVKGKATRACSAPAFSLNNVTITEILNNNGEIGNENLCEDEIEEEDSGRVLQNGGTNKEAAVLNGTSDNVNDGTIKETTKLVTNL